MYCRPNDVKDIHGSLIFHVSHIGLTTCLPTFLHDPSLRLYHVHILILPDSLFSPLIRHLWVTTAWKGQIIIKYFFSFLKLFTLRLIYQHQTHKLAVTYKDYFKFRSETHSRATRNNMDLHISKAKTNYGYNSIKVAGAKLFNQPPEA